MMTKTAYLTIDDAPSATMGEKVDYLCAKGVPAVWFCKGSLLEQRPGVAIGAIQKGFLLGNHAYDHPHFSDLELEECFSQIRRTDEILEQVYGQAGTARPTKCFRFPYGDKGGLNYSQVFEPYSEDGLARKQALQDYLRELGYTQPRWEAVTYRYYRDGGLADDVDWYWTYDVLEWSIFRDEHQFGIDSLEKVFARMEEDEPEGGRGLNYEGSAEIVLIHDHLQTAPYFQPLVERLLAKGLEFALPAM
jgi:peptidoglycan/xylan/chitin deacetylase (PgdA/CDA1 family)